MKTIKHLHKSINEPVYIFATGPSLLKINPDNYKDKICFGINYSFQKMPYLNYIFVHEFETYYKIVELVDNNKLIIPTMLNKNLTYDHFPVINDECYYYIKYKHDLKSSDFSIRLDIEAWQRMFAFTTTTHSAIHIAAYMGATEIYLIGCDYKHYSCGKTHFKTHIDDRYDNQQWHAFIKHKLGDEWIKKQLAANFNIDVINLSGNY